MKYKMGIHLGGNADSQNVLDLSAFKYSELKNPEQAGTGYISGNENEAALKVITPFAGK